MLEFVDSDLYFVQDKNNFINPLLQVGFGSGSVEKSTGSGGPKSPDPAGSGYGSGTSSLTVAGVFLIEGVPPFFRGGGDYRLKDIPAMRRWVGVTVIVNSSYTQERYDKPSEAETRLRKI